MDGQLVQRSNNSWHLASNMARRIQLHQIVAREEVTAVSSVTDSFMSYGTSMEMLEGLDKEDNVQLFGREVETKLLLDLPVRISLQ